MKLSGHHHYLMIINLHGSPSIGVYGGSYNWGKNLCLIKYIKSCANMRTSTKYSLQVLARVQALYSKETNHSSVPYTCIQNCAEQIISQWRQKMIRGMTACILCTRTSQTPRITVSPCNRALQTTPKHAWHFRGGRVWEYHTNTQ